MGHDSTSIHGTVGEGDRDKENVNLLCSGSCSRNHVQRERASFSRTSNFMRGTPSLRCSGTLQYEMPWAFELPEKLVRRRNNNLSAAFYEGCTRKISVPLC